MSFSKALKFLKQGYKVGRQCWEGYSYLKLEEPKNDYIYVFQSDHSQFLWEPKQEDILSKDWIVWD